MASRSCTNCGTDVPATSQFCRNCGMPLTTASSEADVAPPQSIYSDPHPYGNQQPPSGDTQWPSPYGKPELPPSYSSPQVPPPYSDPQLPPPYRDPQPPSHYSSPQPSSPYGNPQSSSPAPYSNPQSSSPAPYGNPQSSSPAPYGNPQPPSPYNPQPPYGNPQSGAGAKTQAMSPIPAYGGPPSLHAEMPWQTQNIWRQKDQLVMRKDAALPDRCVKCNSPANGKMLTKKYQWHHPAWYLLIFAGILIYAIAALVVRKQVILNLGLCEQHLARRRTAILISWLLVALSIGMIIFGAAQNIPAVALLGIPLLFVAAVYGALSASVIAIQKVDDNYVWLKRVNKDYLAMLPEVPQPH